MVVEERRGPQQYEARVTRLIFARRKVRALGRRHQMRAYVIAVVDDAIDPGQLDSLPRDENRLTYTKQQHNPLGIWHAARRIARKSIPFRGILLEWSVS
jgi:hypothetical protein